MKQSSIHSRESGFSLVEISILLLILGILTVPLVMAYNIYWQQQKGIVTALRLKEFQTAVNFFTQKNGRYPLPASLTATEGDANYGMEGPVNPLPCTSAAWQAASGTCDTPGGNVLVGAIPFAALGMAAEDGLDFWNDKIIYAVTKSQANAATFVRTGNGAIIVKALAQADTTPGGVISDVPEPPLPAVPYDMLAFSTGELGIGGFTKDGTALDACGSGTIPQFEDENCDFDDTFLLDDYPRNDRINPAPDGYYQGSRTSTFAAGRYYDDYTIGMAAPRYGNWYITPDDTTSQLAWNGTTMLGIGTDTPSERVEVEGDVRADAGLDVDAMCNEDGSICFNPNLIGGNEDAMDCDKAAFMNGATHRPRPSVAIGNSQLSCASAVARGTTVSLDGGAVTLNSTDYPDKDCYSTDQLVTGIDSAGNVICGP